MRRSEGAEPKQVFVPRGGMRESLEIPLSE